MATSSSSKIPYSGYSSSSPIHRQSSPTNSEKSDSLYAVSQKQSNHRGSSINLQLQFKASTSMNPTREGPELASAGVLVDELRNGAKILVPIAKSLVSDPLIEKIQHRLKELGFRNDDGTELSLDGHFSPLLGAAIRKLRDSLAEHGYEAGEFVDDKLIEYLFPQNLRSNVENRKVDVHEKNAALGEFPDLVKEVQRLLNVHIPEARLLENGKWSNGLAGRICEFQRLYLLEQCGRINAATVKLLRGANLRELISNGDAVLQPGESGNTPVVPFIKLLQPILNKYLKRELTIDGIFSTKTATVLEIAQKAAGISERRVFGKESYDGLAEVIKDQTKRKAFYERLRKINLAQELTTSLGDEARAVSLNHKMNYVSPIHNVPELGILQSLEKLKINIESAAGISAFQRSRSLTADGRINQKTADHLNDVLSANWCKEIVESLHFDWKEGKNQLNVIGLRGWSPEQGPNDNMADEWNDSIAFVWKDSLGLVRYKEYTATTDPGVVGKHQNALQHATENGIPCMEQGQYKYLQGYFNGRAGAAIPVNESQNLEQQTKRNLLRNLKDRLKTFILGSHPFAIHWMETSIGIDNVERVGQLSLGSQVPKINKSRFKREITPLFRANPGGYFLYTLIDMSRE